MARYKGKTKEELSREVERLQQRVTELEASEARHVKAEEMLKVSESRAILLLKNSPDLIMVIDSIGEIKYINHGTPGSFYEDAIGSSAFEFLSETSVDAYREALEDCLANGTVRNLESTDLRGNIYLSRLVPLSNRGREQEVMAIATDITGQKRVEKALRENEESLKKAQQIAQVGSWEWQLETDTFNISDEMRRIYGLSLEHDIAELGAMLEKQFIPKTGNLLKWPPTGWLPAVWGKPLFTVLSNPVATCAGFRPCPRK